MPDGEVIIATVKEIAETETPADAETAEPEVIGRKAGEEVAATEEKK